MFGGPPNTVLPAPLKVAEVPLLTAPIYTVLQQWFRGRIAGCRKAVHITPGDRTNAVLSWRLLVLLKLLGGGGEIPCPQVAGDGKEEPFWFLSHHCFFFFLH